MICIRPLTGIIFVLDLHNETVNLSSRPLTGIIPKRSIRNLSNMGYRPLTGISCNSMGEFSEEESTIVPSRG